MPNRLRNFSLAALAGILGGLTSSFFLISLAWVAEKQRTEVNLLYFLPLAGLLVGGLYDRFGIQAGRGTNLIIEEIRTPAARTPGRMTPMIFFTTLISHLFGASVGREGTAVQMGASLADQLARFFHLSNNDRQVLLKAGASAGFAGALGTPIAGLVFGMEFINKSVRFRPQHLIECTIAVFVSIGINRALGVQHTRFGIVTDIPLFSLKWILVASLLGLLIGVLVRFFIVLTEIFGHFSQHFSKSLAVRAFLGGFILIGLAELFGNRNSLGLGIPEIQAAFLTPAPFPLSFEKLISTAVSIASGFKGGEFIPLVFIGATAASSFAAIFSVPTAFAAACGVTAGFGSAARVPLALSIYAAEHFSPAIFIYALVANAAARLVVGTQATIFPAQRNDPT